MKRVTLISTLVICAAVALLLSSGNIAAQNGNQAVPAPYNPYPPVILPADLASEIARVRREVVSIENEALAQWRALPPPILTGQPPTLQGTGMRAIGCPLDSPDPNLLYGPLFGFCAAD